MSVLQELNVFIQKQCHCQEEDDGWHDHGEDPTCSCCAEEKEENTELDTPGLDQLNAFLQKQRQDEGMEFANNWEEREKERRTKLEELQLALGFPEFTPPEDGFSEVSEDPHLPWDVNESGIPKTQK